MVLDSFKLYYLAHPFKSYGFPDDNLFNESKLFRMLISETPSVKIIRPLRLIPPIEEDEALRRCLKLLEACDTILLSFNWEFSKGCVYEKEYAEIMGKDIIFLEDHMRSLEYRRY